MNLKQNKAVNMKETEESPKVDENITPEESFTSDSESDSESEEESGNMDSDSDCDLHGVVGDSDAPFRFIFGEEAQKQSLDGIAYGLEKGKYFVIGKDGDTLTGLLVHCLIERNIKAGILSPIVSIPKPGAQDSKQKDEN